RRLALIPIEIVKRQLEGSGIIYFSGFPVKLGRCLNLLTVYMSNDIIDLKLYGRSPAACFQIADIDSRWNLASLKRHLQSGIAAHPKGAGKVDANAPDRWWGFGHDRFSSNVVLGQRDLYGPRPI